MARGLFTVEEVEHSGAPDVLTIRARRANLRRKSNPAKRYTSDHENPLQQVVGSSDNAKRLQRKHAELTLELAEGRADLYPETPVTAQGYKPEIDATPWIIDAVIHQFTDSGYTCEIKMQTR